MRACSLACAPSISSSQPGLDTPCLGNDATHGGLGLTTADILSQGMPCLSSWVILGYAKLTNLALQLLRTERLRGCNTVPWNPQSSTEGCGTQGGSILGGEGFPAVKLSSYCSPLLRLFSILHSSPRTVNVG